MARTSRQTKQKEELQQLITRQRGFFTTDDVLTLLTNVASPISSATVYRYLAQQRKMGLIHVYSCQGKTLYSLHKTNHCHFVCEACGALEHIHVDSLDFLPKKLGEVCHVQIDITGTCTSCLAKKS